MKKVSVDVPEGCQLVAIPVSDALLEEPPEVLKPMLAELILRALQDRTA